MAGGVRQRSFFGGCWRGGLLRIDGTCPPPGQQQLVGPAVARRPGPARRHFLPSSSDGARPKPAGAFFRGSVQHSPHVRRRQRLRGELTIPRRCLAANDHEKKKNKYVYTIGRRQTRRWEWPRSVLEQHWVVLNREVAKGPSAVFAPAFRHYRDRAYALTEWGYFGLAVRERGGRAGAWTGAKPKRRSAP